MKFSIDASATFRTVYTIWYQDETTIAGGGRRVGVDCLEVLGAHLERELEMVR